MCLLRDLVIKITSRYDVSISLYTRLEIGFQPTSTLTIVKHDCWLIGIEQ